jgi:hypothetical protein
MITCMLYDKTPKFYSTCELMMKKFYHRILILNSSISSNVLYVQYLCSHIFHKYYSHAQHYHYEDYNSSLMNMK